MEREIIDSVESLSRAIASVRKAQQEFSLFTQEQVDNIFKAVALKANSLRLPLAKLADRKSVV